MSDTVFAKVDYDLNSLVKFIELGEIGLRTSKGHSSGRTPRSATSSTRCIAAILSGTCCYGRTVYLAIGPSASRQNKRELHTIVNTGA